MVESTSITEEILETVNLAIVAEMTYQKLTSCGRKFGITGEVGEILACKFLGLRLVKDPRSMGYDAVDGSGLRIQIKARRSETMLSPNLGGRLSRFSEHPYDYALMVLLSNEYKVLAIWRASAIELDPIIKKHKRRNPTLRQFKAVAASVYGAEELQ